MWNDSASAQTYSRYKFATSRRRDTVSITHTRSLLCRRRPPRPGVNCASMLGTYPSIHDPFSSLAITDVFYSPDIAHLRLALIARSSPQSQTTTQADHESLHHHRPTTMHLHLHPNTLLASLLTHTISSPPIQLPNISINLIIHALKPTQTPPNNPTY